MYITTTRVKRVNITVMHKQYPLNTQAPVMETALMYNLSVCLHLQSSESEVHEHERKANQEHFDILVKHVEEVDLKRIQLKTQLEVRICSVAHFK